MTGPLLLFDTLLPSGDSEPDAACTTFIETEGVSGGKTVPVLLADIALAERWLRTPPSADFARVLALKPSLARLALSDCDPKTIDALCRALRDACVEVELVTRDNVAAIDPIDVEHYGALHREILANGMVWQDEPTPVCRRPERVSVAGQGAEELAALYQRHVAGLEAAFGGSVPARARELHVEGMLLFEDAQSARRLFELLHHQGARLGRIRYRGAGSARGLLTALREALRWKLRHGDGPELRVDPSGDPFVDAAATTAMDASTLATLRDAWAKLDARDTPARVAQRAADDFLRRTTFRLVAEERRGELAESPELGERVAELVGPAEEWVPACRRYLNETPPRVVVVPTWQCELRCTYCTIPKQDGRVMSRATLERAIELLLSSEAPKLELHFFGGEPFLEWELLKHACEWGSREATAAGSQIQFIFTTNAFSLEREMVQWLSDYDVRFQLSIDGNAGTQNAFRRTLKPGLDSYVKSPAGHASWFRDAGVPHDVIQVVHPRNAERMDENFFHLCDMGYRRIQVNFALGTRWPKDAVERFAKGLHRIGLGLEQRWAAGDTIELVNLGESLKRVRTNVEVTVDHDGSIFGSNAFLYIPKYRDEFLLGHLDELRSFDHYAIEGLSGDDLLRYWYKDTMAENNQQVGAVVTSFVRWMRGRHPRDVANRQVVG
jgi:sulfatase maturation enzyme AslB (radical SAM superfamily)